MSEVETAARRTSVGRTRSSGSAAETIVPLPCAGGRIQRPTRPVWKHVVGNGSYLAEMYVFQLVRSCLVVAPLSPFPPVVLYNGRDVVAICMYMNISRPALSFAASKVRTHPFMYAAIVLKRAASSLPHPTPSHRKQQPTATSTRVRPAAQGG